MSLSLIAAKKPCWDCLSVPLRSSHLARQRPHLAQRETSSTNLAPLATVANGRCLVNVCVLRYPRHHS